MGEDVRPPRLADTISDLWLTFLSDGGIVWPFGTEKQRPTAGIKVADTNIDAGLTYHGLDPDRDKDLDR